MYVTFYKCADDPKKINKTLTEIGSLKNITIEPTETISILRPVLVMAYNSNYLGANYVYISEFNRFYFCTISVSPAQRCVISCIVDPLYSFKTDLLKIPVTVIRSESAGVNYVPDKQLPVDPSRFELWVQPFYNPFRHNANNNYAVLINSTYNV